MKKKTSKNSNLRSKSTALISNNTDIEKPIWIFTMADRDGKFAFDLNRPDFKHKEVLDKMINYCNMTWAEIKRQTHDGSKSKHHYLSVDSLSKDALDRIRIRHLEESNDALFSFALHNTLRIVGIRDGVKFYVLWYDPNHEICPSVKKHT